MKYQKENIMKRNNNNNFSANEEKRNMENLMEVNGREIMLKLLCKMCKRTNVKF
jgi:hypothetical protein